jgi:Putative capsular polysaccharide synthesis protein
MSDALQKLSRLGGYPKVMEAVLPRLPKRLRKGLRRFHFKRAIRRSLRSPTPPVLVYTASKVASSAVTHALASVEGQTVFHVHMMSAANIREIREAMRRRGLGRVRQEMNDPEDLGLALADVLIKPRRRARVVSLVRDPVARNISFYFQTLDLLWQTERAHEHFTVERLLEEFHDRFTHERGVDWFDVEFKPVLGVDVYAHPFPQREGFLRIDSGPYEVLLMRHDLDDRLKEKCLADLITVPKVTLTPRNVGAEKSYSAAYGEFLRRVVLPEDYVERMLGSKYARHFFGPEELARFRDKWLRNGRAAAQPEYV